MAQSGSPYDPEDGKKPDFSHLPDSDRGYDPQTHPMGDRSMPGREGISNAEELENAEAGEDGFYNGNGDSKADSQKSLGDQESEAGSDADDDQVGRGFNSSKDRGSGFRKKLRDNRRKLAYASAAISLVGGIVSIAIVGFSSLGLPNAMKNIEHAAFLRYQVDLNGRSTKWIQAYMQLRMGEIDDPHLAPKDRDNLLFRSNRVDNNKPLTDWYRTLRTSSFEQDVFNKQGIKFTSVAYKDGNITKFRPGIITLKSDEKVKFNITEAEINALNSGDINSFNGRLRQFVDVQVFENDKEGRSAIKSLLAEEYPGIWNSAKRWHIRHDIQNMIGTRKWSFFEKTRSAASEKKISIRNKIVTQSLPQDSKAGKFVNCLFGIDNCQTSTDPADPNGHSYAPDGSQKEGDKTGDTDGSGKNQPYGDGSGDKTLAAGADAAAAAGTNVNKIVAAMTEKLGGTANVLSLLDSLSRFDKALHDHSLSKIIVEARTQQAEGLFTTFEVAADHIKTGEVTSSEVSSFMSDFAYPENSESYTKVIAGSAGAVASADSTSTFTNAKTKGEFCSNKHQAAMDKPENRVEADHEYQWLCPQDQIGNASAAATIESSWDNGPGAVLHPVLAAYHATVGGILGVFNSVVGAVLNPVVSTVMTATGLKGTVQDTTAYVAQKALVFGGGVLDVNDNTPSGKIHNTVLQGGTATAEASMREAGGALTTPVAAASINNDVIAYQADQAHASFSERYLNPNNPTSLAGKQVALATQLRYGNLNDTITHSIASAFTSSLNLFTLPTHAQVKTGYEAANFAGIDTYDQAAQCKDAEPIDETPQSVTNADDLGIIPADELTWDLVSDKDAFYKALYDKLGDSDAAQAKALTVWNCGLMDNTAKGAIGAPYGYKGKAAYQSSGSNTGETTTDDDTTSTAEVKLDVDKLYDDSSKVACADNTKNLGTQDGYAKGQKVKIRICAVSNLPSSGEESQGRYGVSGADGKAVVNSRVSAAVYAMAAAAKKDGVNLTANSAFRTMAHQEALCPCDGVTVAKPGTSNHQMGLAIDFGGGLTSSPGPVAGNQFWNWLSKNADNYGYKNYPREAWHWSPTGN